jgi:hypothetical protein
MNTYTKCLKRKCKKTNNRMIKIQIKPINNIIRINSIYQFLYLKSQNIPFKLVFARIFHRYNNQVI